MISKPLADRRILIVEDEYLIADDLAAELDHAGAKVIGPAASVADALELIANEAAIDVAVLDVNLRGENSFPIADALCARSIPVIFISGHGAVAFPARFANLPRCAKPAPLATIIRTIGRAIRL